MGKLHSILPIVLIVFAPMVMLYPIWSNPVSAGEDDVIYYYPLRKMVGEALRQGRLPLYNSLEATGVPLMADPQSAVMYPPTWLFVVLDARFAYSLSIFLAFSLAGGGVYLYLRRIGLIRSAAAFGGIAFMFCGFMVGHRVHLSIIHTACYLPWGLWCIEGLRRRPLRALLWMVPIPYLAITAGHSPTFIQIGLIWAAYLLLRGRPLLRSVSVSAVAMVLAVMLVYPQIVLTAELLGETTRQRIGYATAGENSFFPVAAVLALFPMLMGSRTPNFFPQRWWGPWHFCEMLGYVGLVTLVLAGAGIWCIYRKKRAIAAESFGGRLDETRAEDLQELVRKWAWVAAAAMVLMLGYYLPTYRLVHMIPILGVVRCPARFVVAMDLALGTLSAITIHLLSVSEGGGKWFSVLAGTVRRAGTVVLPIVMLATLAVILGAGLLLIPIWAEKIPYFFVGGARDMLRSVYPPSPAVWVPIALLIATGLGVRFYLGAPKRRGVVLIAVLLIDLFFITRFVDVPASGTKAPDPERSPAGDWLKHNAVDEPYLIWGLSNSYHHRPAELLLPKTAPALGFATIAGYGPFQSPAHAHLLGFRIFGTNRNWERLIRTN
ncbi:MAG: hypothetical protein ACYSTL_02040, partial [Planctomycetota bacterium]